MRFSWFTYDCGSWPLVDPHQPFAQALGGRETAQIRVAQELVKLGHDVDFAMPHARMAEGPVVAEGMRWLDPRQFLQEELSPETILVSVESAAIFEKLSGRLNIYHSQVAHPQPADPIGAQRDKLIDHYFFLSAFQRWSMVRRDPNINPDHVVCFGNGIDLRRYDDLDVQRVPGRLIYSHSPDRGLFHLLRFWPELKERFPHLTLEVFYGVENFVGSARWLHELRSEWARTISEGLALPGVIYRGAVSQAEVAQAQKGADIAVYPCDPLWEAETFCVTALENLAARTPLVLSPADCLQEWFNGCAHILPLPVRDDYWINGLSYLLTHPDERDKFVANGRHLAENQTWRNVAQRWEYFLQQRLHLPDTDLDGILALTLQVEDMRPVISVTQARG